MSSGSKTPPATAFLRKNIEDEDAAAVEAVSNLRLPIMNSNTADNGDVASDNSNSKIPYRGFGNSYVEPTETTTAATTTPTTTRRNFGSRLRNLFSPRNADVQTLLGKLDIQFKKVDMLMEVEQQKDEYDGSGIKDRNDPTHPLNNSALMSDIHYVGRSALDSSIVELSSFLTQRDRFGCITELWLNNNLISDDGASSIAALLQSPSCALVELWLGDNQIGAVGTAEIAAALSTNERSKLKCLGLYKNPIENGGANCLAQMLRTNHTLSTVDVHGCLYDGKKNDTVVESYGCRVVTATDGTEYVAKVVASDPQDKAGYVTDSRLIDAIKTYTTFNRIDPTREQVIRGLSSSSVNGQGALVGSKLDGSTKNERQHRTIVSTFLSDLCHKPSNEKLTDDEKRKWKECEWERLYEEIERARAAARIMAERLQIKTVEEINEEELFGDETDEKQRSVGNNSEDFEEEMLGRELDNEVVRTETKSLRDLKIGITGCPSPRKGKKVISAGSRPLENTPDAEEEKPPQSQMDDEVEATSDEVETQGMSDATLRLMKMVDYLESVQKDETANLDAGSKGKSDNDDNNENEVVGSAKEAKDLEKLEVDTSLLSLSRVSTLGSDNDPEEAEEDSPTQMYHKSESMDDYEYEKSFQASKATLSSAMDFLKELSDHDSTEKSDS
eukprot:scaffold6778_cov97-Skeletonema_dohrnii-CCMP3373.AAC.8